MSQYQLGKKGTSLYCEKGWYTVRLYDTNILKWNEEFIILNSGGYKSVTTKRRLNQASSQFDLRFNVHSEKGKWFVDHHGGKELFKDRMKIER